MLAKKLADTSTSPYCKFDDQKLQTFTSCLFLAGLVASFPAAWVTQHKGRKVSMIISGAMYMIGAPAAAAVLNCPDVVQVKISRHHAVCGALLSA